MLSIWKTERRDEISELNYLNNFNTYEQKWQLKCYRLMPAILYEWLPNILDYFNSVGTIGFFPWVLTVYIFSLLWIFFYERPPESAQNCWLAEVFVSCTLLQPWNIIRIQTTCFAKTKFIKYVYCLQADCVLTGFFDRALRKEKTDGF